MGISRVSRLALLGALAGSALATGTATAEAGVEHQCVVEPRMVVDVGSAASGVIEHLEVERGQAVAAGEVLAELESGVERAALSVARARAGIDTDVETRQVALDFQLRARTRVDELYRRQTVAASAMDETTLTAANFRLIGRGEGIHWPALDEDISVAGILAGHPSGETPESLRRWLEDRNRTS